jgi:hypothetical protein
MPGITLVTNQDARLAMQNVKKVANRLDYSVTAVSESELALHKGNPITGTLLGAFFPYSRLRVLIRTNPDKTVEIDILRNSPWWTGGALGVKRTKDRAEEFADGIADAIREQHGEILRRETI